MTLIDVSGKYGFHIVGGAVDVRELDCGTDALNRRCRAGAIHAAFEIGTEIHGDFRLGSGLGPAGKRHRCARCNQCAVGEKSHERALESEPCHCRRRPEAHLPAEAFLSRIELFTAQRELGIHSAHNVGISHRTHDVL